MPNIIITRKARRNATTSFAPVLLKMPQQVLDIATTHAITCGLKEGTNASPGGDDFEADRDADFAVDAGNVLTACVEAVIVYGADLSGDLIDNLH